MNSEKLKLLIQIYLSFFKIGSVSFGGGYSMIPLIEQEVVERRKWVDKGQIVNILAVSGSLPGAIALNSSAFVGYSIAGVPGALVALVANMTPSVIIVLTLSMFFSTVKGNQWVQAAFRGIYPVIVALIAFASYKLGKIAIKDNQTVIIAVISFLAAQFMNIQPIPLIIMGAFSGLLIKLVLPAISNFIKMTHDKGGGKF